MTFVNPDLYFKYLALASLIAISPGPNAVHVIHVGANHKFRDAVWAIAGIALGLMTYALLVILGLAELMKVSPRLFALIKTGGACYLALWGANMLIRALFVKPKEAEEADNRPPTVSHWALLVAGYVCCTANPNTFVMYLSLLPNFADPDLPTIPQLLILSATHLVVVVTAKFMYCGAANSAQAYIKKYRKLQQCATGAAMMYLGVNILRLTHAMAG